MFFALIKFLALTFLSEVLRPKPQVQHARPAGLSEFGFPTIDPGRPIPATFGTVRQAGPALLWYGGYSAFPLISAQKIKGLFKSKTVYQVTGYIYGIAMHMGLAVPGVQSVHSIRSEERLVWQGSQNLPGTVSVNLPYLYGGPDSGGGLVAQFSFYPGGAAQTDGVTPYIKGLLGGPTLVPAFRGFTGVAINAQIGTAPHIRGMSFETRRIPNLLGLGAINTADANPAEIIWETCMDPVWGARADASLFDQASFEAAGATLASEGLGLSLQWDQRRNFDEWITDAVLRPVDGLVYPSLREGLVKFRLIRDDYDPETVTVLHPGNAELQSFAFNGWENTVNDIKVLFTSRASGYRQDVAPAFDGANYDRQGGRRVTQQNQYPGVGTAAVATDLAWRDLRAVSRPMARATVKANRYAHRLEQGDVFMLRGFEDLQGTQLLMRILKVSEGAPGDRNLLIESVQDVFALASSAYAAPPASEWAEVVEDPEPVTLQVLAEVPYLILLRDDQTAPAPDPDSAKLHIVAARPNGSTTRADIETREGADAFLIRGGLEQFAPTGTLVDAYPVDTDPLDESGTLIVEDLQDAEFLVSQSRALVQEQIRNLALIGSEILAWETITDNLDGTYTFSGVWRGQIDTVPAGHSPGARIYFLSEGSTTTLDTYELAADVDARLIPATARGELDPGEATPLSHVITRRSLRPYPPGAVEIDGAPWTEFAGDSVEITWAHRDRLVQEDLVTQDASDIGPEAGTTYTVRVYDDEDTLIHTEAGIAGTSFTYTVADLVADAGALHGTIRLELEAVRDGYASHQFQERTVMLGLLPFTCTASEAVGDAVYVSAEDTVARALADALATARVVGWIVSKPTATSCLVAQDGKAPGTGLSIGDPVYLSATTPGAGTSTPPADPGDIVVELGIATDDDEYLFAPPRILEEVA